MSKKSRTVEKRAPRRPFHADLNSVPRTLRPIPHLLWGALFGLTPFTLAHADSWFLEPSVTVSLTATSNANFGVPIPPASDEILDIAPTLHFAGQGTHFSTIGDITLDGLVYLQGTEINRIEPHGTADLNYELVDHLLYIDTGFSGQQIAANPYAGQGAAFAATTNNTYTSLTYHVSPYLSYEITPELTLAARSDNSWTDYTGLVASTYNILPGYSGNQSLSLTQKALPIGWNVLLDDMETRFQSQTQTTLSDQSARVGFSYAIDPQIVLGIIGGYEQAKFAAEDIKKNITGLRGSWKPSNVTSLDVKVERRFFGTGWDGLFETHNPYYAFNFRTNRDVSTFPQTMSGLPIGVNVAQQVDNTLVNQYPDMVSRAAAVQNVMAEAGLPANLPGGMYTYSELAELVNSANASLLIFFNPRDTLSVNAFRVQQQNLESLNGQVLSAQFALYLIDNVQSGGALTLSHKLTPVSTVNLTYLRANINGIDIDAGQHALQSLVRLQYEEKINTRTSWFLGARRQMLNSTYVGDSNESAIYAGVTYRF